MPHRPVSAEPCFPGLVSELLSVLLPPPRFFPLKTPISCLPPVGLLAFLLQVGQSSASWPEPIHLDCLSHSRSTPTHTYNPSGQSRQGESEENPAASLGSEMCESPVAPTCGLWARKGVWVAGAGCQHSASSCWNLHLPSCLVLHGPWTSAPLLSLLFCPLRQSLSLTPWPPGLTKMCFLLWAPCPKTLGAGETGVNVELPSRCLGGRPCGQRRRVQAGLSVVHCSAGMGAL